MARVLPLHSSAAAPRCCVRRQMTPCAYSVTERPGGAAPSTAPASPRPLLLLPALVLELDAPCQSKQLAARLQLDAAVMSHMPSIVTLFDAQG